MLFLFFLLPAIVVDCTSAQQGVGYLMDLIDAAIQKGALPLDFIPMFRMHMLETYRKGDSNAFPTLKSGHFDRRTAMTSTTGQRQPTGHRFVVAKATDHSVTASAYLKKNGTRVNPGEYDDKCVQCVLTTGGVRFRMLVRESFSFHIFFFFNVTCHVLIHFLFLNVV